MENQSSRTDNMTDHVASFDGELQNSESEGDQHNFGSQPEEPTASHSQSDSSVLRKSYSLGEQLIQALHITFSPKKTIRQLSSSSFSIIAILINTYFFSARVLRKGDHVRFSEYTGLEPQVSFVALILLSVCALFIWAAILKLLVLLFGKKLSLAKVVNILGFSQAPRLFISMPASIIAVLNPGFLFKAIASELNILMIAAIVLGVVALLYSVFLSIYGLVVAENENCAK